MSFVKKMIFFSAFLMANLVLLGFMAFRGINEVSEDAQRIDTVFMPAVRLAGQADMHHDGLKGAVYQAIVTAGNKERSADAMADLAEQKKELAQKFAMLTTIALPGKIPAHLAEAEPKVKAYIDAAAAMETQISDGKLESAMKLIPEFEARFKEVEDTLGSANQEIVAEADVQTAAALENVSHQKRMALIVISVGILVGLMASAWMVWTFRKRFTETLAELNREATQMQASANTLQQSTHDFSSSTTEQSAAIEETVASMEEMSSMLAQSSQQASRNLEFSEQGQAEAGKGRAVMAKMSSAMDEIQASNGKLDGLVKLILEIKEKTNVINEIVAETRLLSFNASIEAARAGAQGKGFAVVAEEVGKLAAMSGKAAGDIHALLESSSAQVSQVVRDTQERVQSGKKISDECEVMFNAMRESLEKIGKATEMITSATKEQEVGVKQTNQAMADMSKATQANSRSVETLTQQATSLSGGAQSLFRTVETIHAFVLGGKGATGPGAAPSISLVATQDAQPEVHSAGAPANQAVAFQPNRPAGTTRGDSRWRKSA